MNSFGNKFRINIFGESHGSVVGICIDGCPAGISLCEKDFEHDIERRKSGARGTTSRIENDAPEFLSGIFNGRTTGAPITIVFKNENTNSQDYSHLQSQPRPSHADFVAARKFNGFNDYRGGGHFSGRLTLPLVAAGVIAKKIIKNIDIQATLCKAGKSENINEAVSQAVASGDSIGGIIECRAKNVPVGLGEPFFDSVESKIAHLAFAIPAVCGIEFGAGFESAAMLGSRHNDKIIDKNGKTETNNSGGINGGITNGNDLIFRIAVKPASSIQKPQETFDFEQNKIATLKIGGRHDACIAMRVPVIIEAITAIVIADLI